MHKRLSSLKNSLLCLLLLLPPSITAGAIQTVPGESDSISVDMLEIPEITGNMTFDGLLDDPCWQNQSPVPLTMHIPTFGNLPTERSDVYICHDKDYVYVAGRFYDSEPEKINIASKMRDNIGPQEDGFFIIFDTFNDHENAVCFHVNAGGVRQDMTIAHDGTDPFPWSETWNTFWDAKASVDDQGWKMEMRIPLSSLRFEEVAGKVVMGMICFRFIPRKFEIDIFPAIPRNWGFWSFVKPSQAHQVVLAGVKSRKPFYIAPFVTAGINQESVLNDAETAYRTKNDPTLSAGLDLKYGITSNLTADITLNTDFAQVESDNAQVNLTRFSLFFPEKRMFFQERSSNFNVGFDGMNTVFYSRQIGLYEGRQVPIIGGVRLVGRQGPWDFGFLNMQTRLYKSSDQEVRDLPSENFGVLRFKRQIINLNSYIGGILTSRLGTDGTYNEVVGLDAIIRIFGQDYVDVKLVQSFDEKYRNKVISPDASRIWLDWQRRNEKGLGYNFFFGRVGGEYEPDLGFEFRNNYYLFGTKLKYGWIPGESSVISSHKILGNAQSWNDLNGNSVETALINGGYSMDFKSGYGLQVMVNHMFEHLTDTFFLSKDAVVSYIKTGSYAYNYASVSVNSPATKKLSLDVMSNFGQYYDGNQFTLRMEGNANFGSFLSLHPAVEFDRIHFPSRDQSFSGKIASLRALVMFNNKLSISGLIEYSNIGHGVLTNIRLRYNPKEGSDLYIVYNEGRNIELQRQLPELNRIANRGFLVKYTYTFVL